MPRKKKEVAPLIGRPPADWVYKLLALELPGETIMSYEEISERFQVTLRSVHAFGAKLKIPGEYYKSSERGIRKRFKLSDFKEAARIYLKNRGL